MKEELTVKGLRHYQMFNIVIVGYTKCLRFLPKQFRLSEILPYRTTVIQIKKKTNQYFLIILAVATAPRHIISRNKINTHHQPQQHK